MFLNDQIGRSLVPILTLMSIGYMSHHHLWRCSFTNIESIRRVAHLADQYIVDDAVAVQSSFFTIQVTCKKHR